MILLFAGICVAALIAICGVAILFYIHQLMAMLLGAGLVLTGLMILYFMVKFIFESKKADRSRYREVFENDQPDLFAFVRKVSEETGAQFPKHIYLSPEVNASVFYDSNFLSMFLPVKKNLCIGLGLVNMLNLSEFKSVIAHEFGHFSQKSMRAGSYVYQANRVIYNMLYENDNYGRLLNRWASIHGIFALCARLTVNVIQPMQWAQRELYKSVNKQYSALSRQMEFHADAISAMVAGSNNAIHALHRLDFADSCYSNVIDKYNAWFPENIKGSNLYSHQRIMAEQLAAEFQLPLHNGLPLMSNAQQLLSNNNKVSIENQWASHPTLEQRQDALEQLQVTGEVVDESPWVLFANATELQQQLTDELYKNAPFKKDPAPGTDKAFEDALKKARTSFTLPAVYGLFYKDRTISNVDIDNIADAEPITDLQQYCEAKASLSIAITAAKADIALLEHIATNSKDITSFTYEGDKMSSKYAATVKETMQTLLEELQSKLQKADESVFCYMLERATVKGYDQAFILKKMYTYYYELKETAINNLIFCNELSTLLQPYFDDGYIVTAQMAQDLDNATVKFKTQIAEMQKVLHASDMPYHLTFPHELLSLMNAYLSFDGEQKEAGESVRIINEAMHSLANWSLDLEQVCKKQLLDRQAGFL